MSSPRSYLRYEQPFQVPLATARGVWKKSELGHSATR